MTAYPQLTHLAHAYFHQDYDLDAPTPADIVRGFADEEGHGACRELAAEITAILDSDMTNEEIGDLWINTLDASYEPDRDGLSYRDWLASTLQILRHPDPDARASTATSPHIPIDPARISQALVTWTGYGQTSRPQRDEQRLIREIGPDAAADLLPILRGIEDDFYSSNASHLAPDLAAMGQLAAESFRRLHPDISDTAIQALAWCYTYDYK